MPDREKVIRAVDSCFNYWLEQHRCLNPLELENVRQFKADALSMLKKQEAVPVDNGKCPSCNWDFEDGELDFSNINELRFYCPRCGQAVKFEILH